MITPKVGSIVQSAYGKRGTIVGIDGELVTIRTDDEEEEVVVDMEELLTDVPFLVFPCEECNQNIMLTLQLDPGQAAVLECENCGVSWTVVLPSVEVFRTSEYEEIWSHVAQ